MSDTTLEEAQRCPKCSHPGRQSNVARNHPKPGASVYTYICDNDICPWSGQGWIVQVNSDGTIPTRKPGDKQFVVSPGFEAGGRRMLEQTALELAQSGDDTMLKELRKES